jgi:hypothetical protein
MEFPDQITHADFLERFGPLGPELFDTRGDGSAIIRRAIRGGRLIQNINGMYAQFGAKPMDEIYLLPSVGILNISKAHRMIGAMKKRPKPQRFGIDPAALANVNTTECDPRVVEKMTTKRRDEPILFMARGQGVDLIDGHHRLQRRIRDGLDFYDVISIGEEWLPEILVTTYEREGDTWTRFNAAAGIMSPKAPQIVFRRAA